MLSSDFNQKVTNILKNEYNIECHRFGLLSERCTSKESILHCARFGQLPDYGISRESVIHCSHDDKKFTMTLRLSVDKGEYDGVIGSFKINLPTFYAHDITAFQEKINVNLINDSIDEAQTEMTAYLLSDSFCFFHSSINVIEGLYIKNGKDFDVKKIESFIESHSYINFYNDTLSEIVAYVKIIGNEIIVSPEKLFKDDPIFKIPSILIDGGMDLFKANLIKSFFVYRQTTHIYDDLEQLDVDFYLPLTYEELKKQFLVNAMAHI